MESNLAFVGTRASGKTSCAGLLYLAAQDRALRKPLKVRTFERSLDIRGISHLMASGDYPPATPVDENFNATVELEFGRWFKRRVSVSFVDMAGETMRSLMDRFERQDFGVDGYVDLNDINRYILSASGHILVADLPRLMGLEDDGGLPTDTALARFIDAVARYRGQVRRAPKFRGVGLVLTKYDMVRDVLAMEGLAFRSRFAFMRFIRRFMNQTYVSLDTHVGFDNVSIFYSGVETHRDTGKIYIDAARRPVYSRDQYDRLLDWLSKKFHK